MGNSAFIKTAFIAALLAFACTSVVAQQVVVAGTADTTYKEKRTAEEKEYYRLFETPEAELSLDDQILKYKLALLASKTQIC